MDLSKRLSTVAGAVTPGHILADVGTDHGYVPIYLLREGICPRAIAMDVNRGPLERAREHVCENEMTDRIELRLSDGLHELGPGEADTVVIAGMGGELICRILREAPEIMGQGVELVLQPQSEWFKVRYALHELGYEIIKEWFLKEDGKYYVVIKALPASGSDCADRFISRTQDSCGLTHEMNYEDEADYFYGYHLLREKDPVLLEYLSREKEKKRSILCDLERQEKQGIGRYGSLKKEIRSIDRIIHLYYTEDDSKD